MPKWTTYQQSVIDHKGKNLLVSAAAGSGKTAVMIEHIYKQIIENNATVERMLVATYTNAAAASMKEKLINKLDSAFQENPDNTRIFKEKQLVDRSDISTLHAYCIKTLRKYYFYTPLSPDFRIFQGAQLNILEKTALNQIIEEAAKKYNDGFFDEYIHVLNQFASPKNDRPLEKLILLLHNAMAPLPHPEEYKEKVLSLYSDKDGKAFYDYIVEYCKYLLNIALDCCDEVDKKFINTEIGDKSSALISKIHQMLENAIQKDTLSDMHIELKTTFPSIRKCESPLKNPLNDNISIIKNIRETVKNITSTEYDCDMTKLLPSIKGLFILCEQFEDRLDELMLNEGGTDFNGVLKYMVRLLEENPEILQEIRDNTDYIYIDEYQDINATQNYIIETISKGNNMFFVGDVKQSIYGFNYARPDLFKDKMFAYNDSESTGKRINLMNNFRSYPPILDGVNFIFENLMQDEKISEIIYDEDASLYPSPDEEFIQHKDGVYLNNTAEIANEILYVNGDKEAEANAICSRISELLKSEIYDAKTGVMRPVRYNDIAILAKQKSHAPLLNRVFKKHNIPLCAQQNNVSSSDSTSAIKSLLNLFILRRSDIDLITVLLSSIGGFTPSELGYIRENSPACSFYDAFINYDKKADIVKKRDEFITLLDRLEIIQKTMPLGDFIEYIYNETGYIYHASFLPDESNEIKAYVKLVNEARAYSEFADGSLRGFLNYYANLSDYQEEIPFSLDENDNSVHFMTIHKSKGLEFPIVFVMGMDGYRDGGDKTYYFNENLGFGFDYKDIDEQGKRTKTPSIAKASIVLSKKQLERAESLRVFYVALTRAKNKLILSCPVLSDKLSKYNVIPHKANVCLFNKYNELILPLIFNHKDGVKLQELLMADDYSVDFEPEFNKSNWMITVYENTEEESELNSTKKAAENFDKNQYLSKVKESFEYEYPYLSSTTQRTKQNPSKSSVRSKIPLRRPMFEDKEYKGAQKGTIVHFFMEHIDFYIKKSVKEQAENMLNNGILTQEEFDVLPIESIEKFLDSPFGKRLSSSTEICRERSFCQIVPFEDSPDEALVQGIIDCYFFEGDNIVLLDYKTDIIRDNLEDRVLHHTPQLKMYKYALEQLYPGKSVTPFIHFFDINETVEIK